MVNHPETGDQQIINQYSRYVIGVLIMKYGREGESERREQELDSVQVPPVRYRGKQMNGCNYF